MSFEGQALPRTEIYDRWSAAKTLDPKILDAVNFGIEIVLGDKYVRSEGLFVAIPCPIEVG